MLLDLKIENIAVISDAEIKFGEGLNVLTGETGAGKSVVLDAVYAVTGRRVSRDLIRSGRENSKVSALFSNVNRITRQICDGCGIACVDGELLLERSIFKDGKNICRINGKPVTASELRTVSEFLIDIHGQQDNRQMLDPSNHLTILDSYAKNASEFESYTEKFENLHDLKNRLKKLYLKQNELRRKADDLRFTVNELEDAEITPGETEKLKETRLKIRNGEKIRDTLNEMRSGLSGSGDNPGVVSVIKNLSYNLKNISDVLPGAAEWEEKLYEIYYGLDSISESVGNELESINFSERELEKADERISQYGRLFRKYGTDEAGLLEILRKAKGELNELSGVDGQIAVLEDKADVASRELVAAGEKLSETRLRAGERFAQAVCDVLKYLQMPNVKFAVKRSTGAYTKSGRDRIEFLISANTGEPAKPLIKIASGGEMSRVMLAIKCVLLSADKIDTLIFDEIDSGISGYAASCVGAKLKELSKSKQVLCVTHLAQIASRADSHYLVSKSEYGGNTFTSLTRLEGDGRINEIARIMSGGKITENLYRSAKELLTKGAGKDETV